MTSSRHPRSMPPGPAARRMFLRQAGALATLTGPAAPLMLGLTAAGSAVAQGVSDYRAIVCLFL